MGIPHTEPVDFWILSGLLCAFIGWHLGEHRGVRSEGVVLGLVLGPLGLLLLVAFRPRVTPAEARARRQAAIEYMARVRDEQTTNSERSWR